MSESPETRRRRWINLGELIALAALIVSAVGVWITWKGSQEDRPTRVVEQHQAIPLTLRGKASQDGRTLTIAPVEASHALESLRLTLPGASPIELGSDGELSASDIETALKSHPNEPKDRTLAVRAQIAANYVEAGADRHSRGTYTLRYKWEGGGLFGGRSLRFVSFGR